MGKFWKKKKDTEKGDTTPSSDRDEDKPTKSLTELTVCGRLLRHVLVWLAQLHTAMDCAVIGCAIAMLSAKAANLYAVDTTLIKVAMVWGILVSLTGMASQIAACVGAIKKWRLVLVVYMLIMAFHMIAWLPAMIMFGVAAGNSATVSDTSATEEMRNAWTSNKTLTELATEIEEKLGCCTWAIEPAMAKGTADEALADDWITNQARCCKTHDTEPAKCTTVERMKYEFNLVGCRDAVGAFVYRRTTTLAVLSSLLIFVSLVAGAAAYLMLCNMPSSSPLEPDTKKTKWQKLTNPRG